MKKTQDKWLSWCLGACMMAASGLAQVGSTPPVTPTDRDTASTRSDTSKSSQFVRSKDLVGANVKDSQGEKIGDIRELYLNPQSGVTFATIDISGSRDAVLPLQALHVSEAKRLLGSSTEITVNKTKSELQSGPTIAENELHKLDDTSFTRQIFATYNILMPAPMGGAESPGGTSSESSSQPSPHTR
jgi:hypothetical protein